MGWAVLVLEGIPQLLVLAMAMTHWHSQFETVAMDLFTTSVNIPLSVIYLGFYCNPRVQLAVVSKILMEGLHGSAELYGEYVETYLHVENEPGENAKVDGDDETKTCFYDISSITSVIPWQVCYIIICPFIGIYEIGIAFWRSMVRDFGRNNTVQIATDEGSVTDVATLQEENKK